jgi:outer membrane protein TolC
MKRNNAIYLFAILTVTALLLEACSAGKNYKRPDTGIPVSYNTTSSGDSSLAVKPWREFFSDTILVNLIDEALVRNFDLQVAIRRVDVYQSLARQARSAWLPTLSVQASGSTVNPSGNSLNGISLSNFLGTNHLEDYTLGGTLAWEIDVWGKIRRGKEAARADYLQSYEARKAIQTALVAEVADAYYADDGITTRHREPQCSAQ